MKRFLFLVGVIASLWMGSVAVQAQPATERAGTDKFRRALAAKLGAGQTREAIAFFKDELKKANKQDKPALREEFLRGMARNGKPLEAYRAFPGGKEALAILAEQLVGSGHNQLLAELVAEHAVFFADDPFADLYGGQAAFASGKFAEADALWTAAFRSIKDEYLTELFQRRRAEAGFRSGMTLEIYAEDVETFYVLADLCLANRKHAELEKLLEAHLKRNRYDTYTVAHYRFAMQPNADFATLQQIALSSKINPLDSANRLVFSHMAAQGRALEAYKVALDPRDAFEVLARSLADKRSFADLRRLIDLHRKTAPDDPQIADVEVRLLVETNELEKAIAVMKKSLEKDALQGKKDTFSLMRSYAELLYLEAAMRLAEDWEKNSPSRNLVVQILPYAAAGNVGQTMRLMQVHGKRRVNLEAFYRNEDLGPLLRGETLRKVNERFPSQ